ncbi:hypothetical protein OIU34_23620 [Pararhizobium sp. BT-229]|uniref:putative Ig domain-containing protein n=1 Tax=Pararhizobium sp. BT-229 TaxID=2986923 RepID=UPI0021F7BCDC|nr:putative Ig domain-containing protein [Pararhizobium sp. BT-229]MCV9964886.1 hypothetical protein [Pararhizobium sp. BT-229]
MKFSTIALALLGLCVAVPSQASDFMWRTSRSGLLSVNPLAAPTAPVVTPPTPPSAPLVLDVASTHNLQVGKAVNIIVGLSGGSGAKSLSLASPLPQGLSLVPGNGVIGGYITGKPTNIYTPGWDVMLRAQDTSGNVVSRGITLYILP